MNNMFIGLYITTFVFYSNAQLVQEHLSVEFWGSLSSQLDILFTTQGRTLVAATVNCIDKCKDIRQCIGFEICKVKKDLFQCRACCSWKKIGQQKANKNLTSCMYLKMANEENDEKNNVAVNKSAGMTSIHKPKYQHASNAVDDVTVCTDGLSTAHTTKEFRPWIKIDLQDVFDIAEVLVYNRQDGFGGRLHDLLITVDGNYCGFFNGRPAATGDRILFLCPSGNVGRNVKLMIQSAEGEEDILCVCEVQVFVHLSKGVGWDKKK